MIVSLHKIGPLDIWVHFMVPLWSFLDFQYRDKKYLSLKYLKYFEVSLKLSYLCFEN